MDYRVNGERVRVNTGLSDSAANRKVLERKLSKIEHDIALGAYEPNNYFSSPLGHNRPKEPSVYPNTPYVEPELKKAFSPLFSEFIEEWFEENQINWRASHIKNIKNMVVKYYLSEFGEKRIGDITRADILKFRVALAKLPGRNGNKTLSPNRINKIMDPLKRVFEEASDRFDIANPYLRVKPLKVRKQDINPFALDEVNLILSKVRGDYRNYYTVRFYTGMRTGEIDGLKWKYIDFENRIILIRETLVDGEEEYTKTDSSQREIVMSQPVYEALCKQHEATAHLSKYVFCNLEGHPLDHNNVTKRVWYPLLAHLKLEKRRPYQSRHTTATLWLAAGEAPEWIARQLGHSTTEMLFRVYSRYVPNLTRRDGSAFERLLSNQLD